jgi:hypothetical protein
VQPEKPHAGWRRSTTVRRRFPGITDSLLLMGLLACVACSRSGTVSGEVAVTASSGTENPAAYLRVRAIPATTAFERDWTAALADFERELEPVRQATQAAAAALGQARTAWDRAVAVPRGRQRDPRASGQEQALWRQLREAEMRLQQARRREQEAAKKHEAAGMAVLARHTAQEVLTDASGRYVAVKLPAGTVYVYTRLVVEGRPLVWFRPVRVRGHVQQVDLTPANVGGWPFAS